VPLFSRKIFNLVVVRPFVCCSIQKAENSERVKDFLQKHTSFELESELLTLPSAEGFDRDGGYVAVITKK
jgi:16S rRNA C967 or C1407 C5-methylase (RsmB/RsmF family)